MNTLGAFINSLVDNNLIEFKILGNSDEEFVNRIKIQKFTYLARKFGLDMGYDFTMYLHGPYSSSLTSDYYELAKNDNLAGSLPTEFRLNEFVGFVKDKDAEWLEIASSLIRLREFYKDRECLTEKTSNAKPFVTKERISSIINTLEENNMIAF